MAKTRMIEWMIEVTSDASEWIAPLDVDAVARLMDILDTLVRNDVEGAKLLRTTHGHPHAKFARHPVREAHRQAPTAPVSLVAADR